MKNGTNFRLRTIATARRTAHGVWPCPMAASEAGRQEGQKPWNTDGPRTGTSDWLPSHVTNYQVSASYQGTVARQATLGYTPKVLPVISPRLYSNVQNMGETPCRTPCTTLVLPVSQRGTQNGKGENWGRHEFFPA